MISTVEFFNLQGRLNMAVILIDPDSNQFVKDHQIKELEDAMDDICSRYTNCRLVMRITLTEYGFLCAGYRENASHELLKTLAEEIAETLCHFRDNINGVGVTAPKSSLN